MRKQDEKELAKQVMEFAESAEKGVGEIIDMPMFDFCGYLSKRNVGELRIIRGLLEQKVTEVDARAKRLTEVTISSFNKEERETVGMLYYLVANIVSKIGYLDYRYLELTKPVLDKINESKA